MLAANVEMYQKMGLDKVEVHADIDVGGYAWAKYGYVPTRSSWNGLSNEIEGKLRGISNRPSGGGDTYTPESWEELSDDQQRDVQEAWMRSTHDEFVESEIESWRDSGSALEQAKQDLASNFTGISDEWAAAALNDWRDLREEKGEPDVRFSNKQILAAISIDYSSRYDDGRGDPEITFHDDKLTDPIGFDPAQQTLPGIEEPKPHEYLTDDMRSEIEKALIKDFNSKAEDDAGDVEPPDYLSENVDEYQSESWDSMRDSDKYRWARDNGELPEIEVESDEEPEPVDIGDKTAADALKHLANSSDPKALWQIADSKYGKQLLLGTDWSGALDLHDKETMDRFNAYVGKGKKS
jgi:hypothetical protein